jgi:CxxC motif-containing protein
MSEKVTCISCPLGCSIIVEKNGKKFNIIGQECKKGSEYAIREITNPQRVLTSTVKIKNGFQKMLPVRSEKAIPKKLIRKSVKELSEIVVKAPIKRGDIIYKNILNTGVNIVSSRDMEVL